MKIGIAGRRVLSTRKARNMTLYYRMIANKPCHCTRRSSPTRAWVGIWEPGRARKSAPRWWSSSSMGSASPELMMKRVSTGSASIPTRVAHHSRWRRLVRAPGGACPAAGRERAVSHRGKGSPQLPIDLFVSRSIDLGRLGRFRPTGSYAV